MILLGIAIGAIILGITIGYIVISIKNRIVWNKIWRESEKAMKYWESEEGEKELKKIFKD